MCCPIDYKHDAQKHKPHDGHEHDGAGDAAGNAVGHTPHDDGEPHADADDAWYAWYAAWYAWYAARHAYGAAWYANDAAHAADAWYADDGRAGGRRGKFAEARRGRSVGLASQHHLFRERATDLRLYT